MALFNILVKKVKKEFNKKYLLHKKYKKNILYLIFLSN